MYTLQLQMKKTYHFQVYSSPFLIILNCFTVLVRTYYFKSFYFKQCRPLITYLLNNYVIVYYVQQTSHTPCTLYIFHAYTNVPIQHIQDMMKAHLAVTHSGSEKHILWLLSTSAIKQGFIEGMLIAQPRKPLNWKAVILACISYYNYVGYIIIMHTIIHYIMS